MIGNFEKCLKEVLKHEGGFVNHPRDPGGITNLGVTRRVYEEWLGRRVTEDDMRRLSVADVTPLYRKKYWDAVEGDSLPLGLDLCVFDFGVNAGTGRAARYLQMMIGAEADGVIGPKTLERVTAYVKQHGIARAIQRYQELREAYYRKLPHFPTFGRGWLNRVDDIDSAAVWMAR